MDSEGKVTFYATKGDGYSIRLSNLRPSLAYHYGDTEFLFPKDTTKLFCNLENKPIDYTVQVVNSADEPVRDVLVLFSSRNGQFVKEVLTDSEGYCVIRSDYDPVAYCQILSLPNEYALLEYGSKFDYDSFDTKIVLNTYGECGISAEQVYTVKLHDEYGEPLKDMVVQVSGFLLEDDSLEYNQTFRTNQQGCITFAGSSVYYYRIRILNNPDYYQPYTFAEGSRELTVQMKLHTYTVTFIDQYGQPVPGVEIYREEKDGTVYYTSDEDGTISFVPKKDPDERVYFLLEHPPVGYQEGLDEFFFLDNSTNMVVAFQKLNVEYHIIFSAVLPNGMSTRVDGAFDIIINDVRYSCETDLYGKCTVELPYLSSVNQISIDLITLPEAYASYLLSEISLSEQYDWPVITIRIGSPWDTPD